MDFDLTLVNGSVIDGTGRAPFKADCGILGGRVAAVGELSGAAATRTLDVSELSCAPGFVDTHAHSDLAAFLAPDHDDIRLGSVRQGVTTEVCGNCGVTPFPVDPAIAGAVTQHLTGVFGPATRTFPSLEEMVPAVMQAGLVNNLAPLVGQLMLRAAVVGFDDRPATDTELDGMADLLEGALRQGAVGLSTGLAYTPGNYAPTAEVAYLARVVAAHGRIYATHMRNETDEVTEAIDEALEVATDTGVRVHLSHRKAAGQRNWGRMGDMLSMLDDARSRGVDVTADMYPHAAGSTLLDSLLPPWVSAGGIDALLHRLGDRDVRRAIAIQIDEGIGGWQNFVGAIGWENVVVARVAGHSSYEGESISALASAAAVSDIDFVCDLVISERASVMIIIRAMHEGDVCRTLSWDHAMVGSDGVLLPGKPHPRLAGSFARVRGSHRANEEDLVEAIRKMTSLPAGRFGLHDRGRLVEGAVADIVVFDPLEVEDRATYEDPLLSPVGVPHVLVAGVTVISHGEPTGTTPGQFVRAL